MRDLLVIVPSRGRPERLRVMLEAALGLSQAATDVAVALDDDDAASYFALQGMPRVWWTVGPRDTLTGWTNRIALQRCGEYRALASFGDDHVPRTPGWDRLLLSAIDGMGGTGIAYGDDLLQGERLPTAPVISSDIVAALGWMCLPSLRHYRVDDVWRDLGQAAGCLAYVPDAVTEHCHPGNGKGAWDATYADGAARDGLDEAPYADWRRHGLAAGAAKIMALREKDGSL